MRPLLLAAALLCIAQAAAAQDLERPAEWKIRFDRPNSPDSALYFVEMPPGWHITTGPACILYDPARTATGDYHVQSEIFLFPGERREAFGVFLGGRDLDGPDQSYTYFLIRKDGSFLIKQRRGRQTETLSPWKPHEAIVEHDGGEGTAKNVLEIRAGAQTVDFYVNAQQVASLPRSSVDTDGIVGLRVNHGLNLHVSSLSVEQTR
jgi:hypothetical protein